MSSSLDTEEDGKTTITKTTSAVLNGFLYNQFTKSVIAKLPLTPSAHTTVMSNTGDPLTVSVIFHEPESEDGHKKRMPSLRIEERQVSDNIPAVVKAMRESRKYTMQKRKEDLNAVGEELAEIMKEVEEGKEERQGKITDLLRIKGLHKKEIKQLEKTLLEVKYKETSVVSSVVIPAGCAIKLEWFEVPVLWCPTMAKEVEIQEKDRTKMIDIDFADVTSEHSDGFIMGDGKLYAVGGHGSGKSLSSVECFDSKTNRWEEVASLGGERERMGVAVYGRHIYAVGGYLDCGEKKNSLKSVERYDRGNGWREVASIGSKRKGLRMAVYGGYLYAVGGSVGKKSLRTVQRYDRLTNRWEEEVSMSSARCTPGVAVYGGYLYAVGGALRREDGKESLSSVEKYDSKTGSWDEVASMGAKRWGAGVAVCEGYLYAVGGFDGNNTLKTVERYDSKTNSWEERASMKVNRQKVGVAVYGGFLYVVGGHDGKKNLKSVEKYDVRTDSWEEVEPMSTARRNVGVAVY